MLDPVIEATLQKMERNLDSLEDTLRRYKLAVDASTTCGGCGAQLSVDDVWHGRFDTSGAIWHEECTAKAEEAMQELAANTDWNGD